MWKVNSSLKESKGGAEMQKRGPVESNCVASPEGDQTARLELRTKGNAI